MRLRPWEMVINGSIPALSRNPPTALLGVAASARYAGRVLTTLDFNVSKTFKITERHAVDLRAEFINLANHPILNAPNTVWGRNWAC